MSLKIIFAGTPEFAVPTLQALINSAHEVIAVYSQPDRPAGRGRKVTMSPVKYCAIEKNIPVYQPTSLKTAEAEQELAALKPDLMVVVAYGLILPKKILEIPKFGCLNVHASLLPKWRGAAPIQHALLAGDIETGVTIMQMDEGLDTGDMLYRLNYKIQLSDTSAELHERLAKLGAEALIHTLDLLEKKMLQPEPQDASKSSYAGKINKEDAKINWQLDAQEIVNKIRAYNPWPVAYTEFNRQPLRIWRAETTGIKSDAKPGTLMSLEKSAFVIACGEGAIRVLQCQLPGGKPIAAMDFINANYSELLPAETRFE